MAFRVAIGVLVLAAIVAAFSVGPQPAPIGTEVNGQLIDGGAVVRNLDALAAAYPDRRAGSRGDAALAQRVRAELRRAVPAAVVTTDRFVADTPDGSRDLVNVSATLPGEPGPEVVVIAHRDALDHGARAELSGTAGLVAVARAAGRSRLRHTVRFVSTDAGSGGGLAGATRLARSLGPDVAGVIVLGDLAGSRGQRLRITPWSNGGPAVALRLARTVDEALRVQGERPRTFDGIWDGLVRRAIPATVGEQGEIAQAGVPAVLVSSSGERAPAADAPVDPTRLEASARAIMHTINALDDAPDPRTAMRGDLIVFGRTLPLWAVRLLLLAIMAPLAVGAVALVATLRRDRESLAAGAGWVAGCAAGPLVAGLLAVGLGRIGVVSPATPAPFAGPALDLGVGPWLLTVLVAAVLVAVIAVARPALARDASGRELPDRTAVTVGIFVLLAVATAALIVIDPLTAVLILPALVAWPAATAPLRPLVTPHRLLLVLVGAALPLAAVATVAVDLSVPWYAVPWWALLLVAGGHVTPVALVVVSLVLGALVAAVSTLVPGRRGRTTGPRRPPDPGDERPHPAGATAGPGDPLEIGESR